MSKQEFLAQLREGLSGLPREDMEARLAFYSEMIDDRMEEGLSEEEAVSTMDSVDAIVAQVIEETPFVKIAKKKIKAKRRLSGWEIALLAIGSPIWLSLGISAVAIVLSLYISLWAVIVSLWAVFASLVGCAFGSLMAGVTLTCVGSTPTGIVMIAAGLVCVGLSIFAFYGCKAATKGILIRTKRFAVWMKNYFLKKGGT